MRRDIGSMAGLLAVLAVALHTAFPTIQESGSPPAPTETKSGSKKPGSGSKAEDVDEPPEGPWLATRAFFPPDSSTVTPTRVSTDAAPDAKKSALAGIFKKTPITDTDTGQLSRLRGLFGIPPYRDIYSIVATVPDPLHTRLALTFDGTIDAIERAAEYQGWTFASQWLPWLDPANGAEDGISERRHQRRLEREQERYPGILVFRPDSASSKYQALSGRNGVVESDVLLVFLVPESPTGGIARESFYAALNLASLLPDNPRHEIGLLAPTFSGSFRSLVKPIEEWTKEKRSGSPRLHRTVFGASISSSDAAAFFEDLNHRLNVVDPDKFTFRSGIASSTDYQDTFECEVLPRYRVDRAEAAYLIELESGYGGDFSRTARPDSRPVSDEPTSEDAKRPKKAQDRCAQERRGDPIRVFRFPRDVSHLRNAYREATQRSPATLPTVDFTLKDPARGEDSIPTFSETGNAIEQSAALDLIVEELKHERIRLLYVTATNELDLVFLTQVLRRQSPDTRIVIGVDPDVLFLPAAAQDPLVGTLFLSTYPTFFHGDEWFTPDTDNEPQSSENSTINTMQLLLGQLTGDKPTHLRSYARLEARTNGPQYPGLWLLTLTRFGFLPVDWSNAHRNNSDNWFENYKPTSFEERFHILDPILAPTAYLGTGEARLEELFKLPEPSLGWYFTTFVSSIVIFIGCFFLVRSNWVSQRPLWLVLTDNRRSRIPVLLGACLSLSAVEWILILPALHIDRPSWVHHKVMATVVVGLLGFLAPLLAGLAVLLPEPLKGWAICLFEYCRSRTSKGRRAAKQAVRPLFHRTVEPATTIRDWIYYAVFTGFYVLILAAWAWSCGGLSSAGDAPTLMFRLRSLQLYSGASPALPLLLLVGTSALGFVGYFYRFTQAGIGRPRLFSFAPEDKPKDEENQGAQPCHPVQVHYAALEGFISAPMGLPTTELWWRLITCCIAVGLFAAALSNRLRSFERPGSHNLILYATLAALTYWLAVGCYDLWFTWRNLRGILRFIEYYPMEEAFARVARSWPRRPVWAFWRAVSRQYLIAQMMRALHNRRLAAGAKADSSRKEFEKLRAIAGRVILGACDQSKRDLEWRCCYHLHTSRLAQKIWSAELIPHWKEHPLKTAGRKAPDPEPEQTLFVRSGADFVALQLCGYILYAARQIQLIGWGVTASLLMLSVVLTSYTLQAPQIVGRFMALAFVLVGLVVVLVFAGMERSSILSRIARSKPGELNAGFWFQIAAMGILPAIGVLAHLFPSAATFLSSWVAPSLDALR